MKMFEADLEQANENLEEEQEARSDLEKELSKAKNEVASWKRKFDDEGTAKAEELESARYYKMVVQIRSCECGWLMW